jgi:hypothetical protein
MELTLLIVAESGEELAPAGGTPRPEAPTSIRVAAAVRTARLETE